MTKLLLLTLSLATGALPSKTPATKKFLSALQKEISAVTKKVPQGVKKIGDKLEQKGLKTAEKKALEQSSKLLKNPYKNIGHLIENAGKLKRKCRGVKQGKIQGNIEHIFKNLAQKHSVQYKLKEKKYFSNLEILELVCIIQQKQIHLHCI